MLDKIKEKVFTGKRLTAIDALTLFSSADIFTLGELASFAAKNKNREKVFYVINRHINPTNICVNRCKFCAFSRSKGEDGAYELTIDEIIRKLRKTPSLREVHIVGGLHPDWPFEHYIDMLKTVKKIFPQIHIKGFTATEIDYMRRISGLKSVEEVLKQLKDAGLDLIAGGGAEIFNYDVRQKLCPEKLSGEGWLDVMRAAHGLGIKSNATMLYGHIEGYEHRVEHLLMLRKLQDATGGFQAFIPLAYHPMNTEIGGGYSSAIDDLKTIAVSRLVLDNIPHIKAYWVMLGEKLSQLALLFGADDLDGTIMEEKITHSAGAQSREFMTEGELRHLIEAAGKKPVRRDSFYRELLN